MTRRPQRSSSTVKSRWTTTLSMGRRWTTRHSEAGSKYGLDVLVMKALNGLVIVKIPLQL